MNQKQRNEARERIATAVLAAMLGAKDEWGAGKDGLPMAEIACDYAESLLNELQRRASNRDGAAHARVA